MVLTCCNFLWAFLSLLTTSSKFLSKKTLCFCGRGMEFNQIPQSWQNVGHRGVCFHWAYHLYTIPKWGVYKTNHWEYVVRIMGSVPYNMILIILSVFCWQKWASVPAYPKLWQFKWGNGKLMIYHELLGHPASFIHNPP